MKFSELIHEAKKKSSTTRYENLGLKGAEITKARKKGESLKPELKKRYGKKGMWPVLQAIREKIAKGVKDKRRKK